MSQGTSREAPGRFRFKEQKIMRRVCLALTPALVGGVYFFGWRSAVMCAWVMAWVGAGEWFLARRRGDPLTESALVTGMLLGLSLPPTIPFWMALVGALVAVSFGKEFFGGFGRNVFNPAIVGRAFLYVCFPVAMTRGFVPAYWGGGGGFLHWTAQRTVGTLDAVSAATPMWVLRDYGYSTPFLQLLLGNIHGVFTGADGTRRVLAAGSVGEVSALLVTLGGLYLLLTRTAQWRLALSSLCGAAGFALLLRHVFGVAMVPPLHWVLCSGALLYACFFMVTDPVSAPNDRTTQWIYGALIGAFVVLFRWKAVFAGGVGFAILMGNTIGPSVEMVFRGRAKRGRTKASPARAAAGGGVGT
ncbi:MAG: RnfABCDGE type electron transport complex subunit D [Lentisphaeria bacterium]|nr:RnfABCDGE type electron transport complex subunit D [Lentisphaeria bacterium]